MVLKALVPILFLAAALSGCSGPSRDFDVSLARACWLFRDAPAYRVAWLFADALVHGDPRAPDLGDKDDEACRVLAHYHARLADAGKVHSQFLLANAHFLAAYPHWEDIGVPGDDELALQWLRKAATGGHAQAQYQLGLLYLTRNRLLKPDVATAGWWLTQAAQKDVPEAQMAVSRFYREGWLQITDPDIAAGWWEKAARLALVRASVEGHNARAAMGFMLETHVGYRRADFKGAFKKYVAAIPTDKRGFAAWRLGILYEKGLHLGRSGKHQPETALALDYYRLAALSGNAPAHDDYCRLADKQFEPPHDDHGEICAGAVLN